MPVPLLIWGAIAVASAVGGVAATVNAKDRINSARRKYTNRRRRYERAVQEYKDKHQLAASRFEDLGKTRLEAVISLGKAVTFLEKAKLKERDLFEKFDITPEQLVQFRRASVQARELLGGLSSSATSGVATAAAAYGLVGTLASAGTGTAISALSGAAAKSATLAWLGGGTIAAGGGGVAAGTAVLGGLVVGPALLVVGFFAQAKAGDVENQVEKHIAEMDTDEADKRKLLAALDAVLARIAEVKKSTIKLQNELETLLSSSSPKDEHDTYLVAKTSVALGQLLDIAILDQNGRII